MTGGAITRRDKLVHTVENWSQSEANLVRFLMVSEAQTNSLHHQAVKELGEGLSAVAWAEDGVIEAIEHAEKRFVIGGAVASGVAPESGADADFVSGFC